MLMMECCLKKDRRRRSRVMEWRLTHLSLTIFFFCICVCATCTCHNTQTLSESMSLLIPKADNNCFKKFERNKIREMTTGITPSIGGARRLLRGPGSSPPRCNSKCGQCTPCVPVLVPVPPSKPVATEYYPVRWRCKCGNKLYMP